MQISPGENLRPKIWLTSLDEVTSLLLKHRVLVGNRDEFVVAEPFRIGDVCEVGITFLAELPDHHRVVQLCLVMSKESTRQEKVAYVVVLQERLGIVVAVNIDLRDSVENRSVLTSGLNPSLEPRQNQFQPVAFLDFMNELVNWEVSSDRCEQALNSSFIAVDVEQPTNHLRRANGINPLNVNLDELG